MKGRRYRRVGHGVYLTVCETCGQHPPDPGEGFNLEPESDQVIEIEKCEHPKHDDWRGQATDE